MSTDKEFLDDNFIFSEDSEPSEKIKDIKSEEPYPIKKEIPKKEKPKYKGKENVVSVQKKKKSDSERAQTKLISISAKNKKVFEILKDIKRNYPSESDFICQAIIEKYDREQAGKSSELKDVVKEILEEMIGEKFIIMKSSSDIINITNNNPIIPQKESIKEETSNNDNANLIRGVMDMWDED